MRVTTARMLASEDYSAVPKCPSVCMRPYRAGAPYALSAVEVTLSDSGGDSQSSPPGVLAWHGDLVVAICNPKGQSDMVTLSVEFHGVLASIRDDPRCAITHLVRPEMDECRSVQLAPGRWQFPWRDGAGDPSVLQLIASPYLGARLVPSLGSFGARVTVVYCNLLDLEERRAVANTYDLVRCVDPGRRRRAAARIQEAWRDAISDPAYTLCRRRLMREFDGLCPATFSLGGAGEAGPMGPAPPQTRAKA